jgi:hypothetical protein
MYRRLKQRSTWTIAVILICSGQFLAAQAPTVKIAVLNLRDHGWQPPDPLQPHEVDTVERRSIAIDHLGRVLVGFAVRERSGLVTREQPAFSLHVVRLLPDGKMDLSLSLDANGWRNNSIYLSDRDQIIVRANDSLQLLQADSGQASTGNTLGKTIAPCGWNCRITQSPSRRTLLLYDVEPLLTLIDTSRLPIVKRCAKPRYETDSITDNFAYFSEQTPRLEISTYRWPLCDYEHRAELPFQIRGRYTVLNDQSFVANGDALVANAPTKPDRDANSNLEVISFDGHVKFRQHMPKHEHWDNFWVPIRSSERGDRIAVDILTTRGGNRTLDISSHVTARRIAVFDIEAGKELASVPVNPAHRYRFEFDLSQDGRRIAILEDDAVKVVDLEEAAKPVAHTGAVDEKDGAPHLQIPIPATKPKQ